MSRREGFKATPFGGKDKRREEMLERQKAARRDLTNHARELVLTCVSEHNNLEEMDEKSDHTQTRDKKREKREKFAKQLMYPQWLDDLPWDLSSQWYVLPRPEGTRCLVIAYNGVTISRKTNGSVLHRFASSLPNGSGPHREKNSHSILDCIFHPPNNTYYVLDLMSWKSYNLYDCLSEFRLSWMSTKLSETTAHTVSTHNKYRFLPVPYFDAGVEGLMRTYPHEAQWNQEFLTQQALQLENLVKAAGPAEGERKEEHVVVKPAGQPELLKMQEEEDGGRGRGRRGRKKDVPFKPPTPQHEQKQMPPSLVGKHGFVQDGIIFLHKQTHYELGVTPLVLLWKDRRCSRFFLETEDGSTVSTSQIATLSCHKDRSIRCVEGQVLGTLPEVFVAQQGFEDGELAKFGLEGIHAEEERVEALSFLGRASKSRILADTWSKVVFQHKARLGTALPAEALLQFLQMPQLPRQLPHQQQENDMPDFACLLHTGVL